MSKYGRKLKEPDGYDYVEPIMTALENELRDKVNEPHEGLRKTESQWPIHQINWQKTRYIYDMYYKHERISRDVYDYCIKNKLVDAALIAKWKKPGFEKLCSTYVINPKNYKFGTVSICRVPKKTLAPGTIVEDPFTGCRGCASGDSNEKNIFGNKYGQYLADIQIAREEMQLKMHEQDDSNDDNGDADDNSYHDNGNGDADDNSIVGAADGSSGNKKLNVWSCRSIDGIDDDADGHNSKRNRVV